MEKDDEKMIIRIYWDRANCVETKTIERIVLKDVIAQIYIKLKI